MAYEDELGWVLDRLPRGDLYLFGEKILKLKPTKLDSLNDYELRVECSRQLRRAAGHAVNNRLRGDHDLTYPEIVKDVARRMKIEFNPQDSVLTIEGKLIDEFWRITWDKSDDVEKEKLFYETQSILRDKGLPAESITMKTFSKAVKTGITRPEVLGILGLPGTFQNVGWLLGYNVFQQFLLAAIYRYFGLWSLILALGGFGWQGLAIRVVAYLPYVGAALAAAYTLHKLLGPDYRVTGQAVFWIATKRFELMEAQ